MRRNIRATSLEAWRRLGDEVGADIVVEMKGISARPARLLTRRVAYLLLLGLAASVFSPLSAKPVVLGWIEWSWIEPGHIKIKTKLDTGAKTSSLHAVDIETYEMDGENWVRFRVPLSERPDDTDHVSDLVVERALIRKTKIKDHVLASAVRYVVDMQLCVGGKTFTTPVNLADRREFNYPLLLGREALKKRALVDSARSFTASKSCDHLTELKEPRERR